MSDLNEETIRKLAKLSRIAITDEEVPELFSKLKHLVDYVELLEEVDTENATPYSHMQPQGLDALREDEVGELLPRETFLKNAPDQVGGMIKVPSVIKQD